MDYIDHYKKDAEEFDYFAERAGASKDDEKRLREYIISRVPINAFNILDAGCGSAWCAKSLLPIGRTVISTDISFINVKRALELNPSEKHFGVVCDSFNLPFKENSIDTIIASEIIEHTVDPEKFAESLFSVIKKGGALLVSTPYKEKIQYSLCIHCNKKTPMHAHLHSFDENILISIGYKIKAILTNYHLFGNKYLIFGRTYVLHSFLPFIIWKAIDSLFNKVLGKPVHILMEYIK